MRNLIGPTSINLYLIGAFEQSNFMSAIISNFKSVWLPAVSASYISKETGLITFFDLTKKRHIRKFDDLISKKNGTQSAANITDKTKWAVNMSSRQLTQIEQIFS